MRAPRLWLVLTAAFVVAGLPSPATGEERVAFIVGNSRYTQAGSLKNPANDSAALATTFARLGYHVTLGRDLSKRELEDRLRSFFERLAGADVAVFFYAGHGLQVNGKNFLVPVDFDPGREGFLTDQLMQLDIILDEMAKRSRHNLIFLDACRDNPFADALSAKLSSGRSVPIDATRGVKVVGTGLAELKGSVGTLIAYATQPGNVASDGTGANSPFTAGLLRNLEEPGIEVRELLTKVRLSVVEETSGTQIPWDHSSLIDNFYIKKTPRRFAPPP